MSEFGSDAQTNWSWMPPARSWTVFVTKETVALIEHFKGATSSRGLRRGEHPEQIRTAPTGS